MASWHNGLIAQRLDVPLDLAGFDMPSFPFAPKALE